MAEGQVKAGMTQLPERNFWESSDGQGRGRVPLVLGLHRTGLVQVLCPDIMIKEREQFLLQKSILSEKKNVMEILGGHFHTFHFLLLSIYVF